MKNLLTALYFDLFKLREREKSLMNNTKWDNSEPGRLANVRNDQSISEARQFQDTIKRLIDICLESQT